MLAQNNGKEQITPHSRDKASYIPILNQLLEASGRPILVEKSWANRFITTNHFPLF